MPRPCSSLIKLMPLVDAVYLSGIWIVALREPRSHSSIAAAGSVLWVGDAGTSDAWVGSMLMSGWSITGVLPLPLPVGVVFLLPERAMGRMTHRAITASTPPVDTKAIVGFAFR